MKFSLEMPRKIEQKPSILVHEEWVGLMPYKLEVEKEQLESWNNQVELVYKAIQEQNFEELGHHLKNDK